MLDTTNADQDTTTNDVGPGALYAICTSGTSTPMLRFQSANVSGTSFRLKGADGTTYITYTLWEGNSGSSGTSIAYNTDAAFTGFTADGTRKTLALSMEVPHANKVGKGIQLYSDTITVTSSYAP
jgi:spore coat protein U-like protein